MVAVFVLVGVAAWGELLRERMTAHDQLDIAGITTDSGDAFDQIAALDPVPDVFLIEVGADDALKTARGISQLDPAPRVVAVGLDADPGQALAWATAGAIGLVARTAGIDELVGTLRGVARGEAPCSPAVVAALLRGVGSAGERLSQKRAPPLTAREHEVARLIADGLSNKEIATVLQIEPGTVKSHVHSVIRKLRISRRAQVAAVIDGDGGMRQVLREDRLAGEIDRNGQEIALGANGDSGRDS